MTEDHWIYRWLWPLLASVAGSITALSFQPWQSMTRGQIALGIFVGTSFAFFVAPTVFSNLPYRVAGGVFYLMASGSNILIPWAIKKLAVNVGYTEGRGDVDR